ncbi:MAG: pyruvate ferredoxin oxidoreductase [Alphaproteobacteria bacterium]|nr:pyruvate ferredoxin oxidoreductase [Alphaproteobacteria bacterium]
MDARANRNVTNVLIVGVGGQGVVMVSKVLALLCQQQGYDVKQSEVHGMAKRGGAVFGHVRYGDVVHSPTIPAGEADILVSLEWAEGMRWLDQLNPDTGIFISDTHKIVPPFACRNRRRGQVPVYSKETPAEILDEVAQGYALDAAGIATRLGNERAANTVLLGLMSTALGFPEEAWLDVICDFVPAKSVEINKAAFLEGREWVKTASVPEAPVVADPMPDPGPEFRNELEIIPAWCKGCDICVRMCPEKCLELNADQVVVIPRPDDCTGCRICEWLCPDFAIKLHTVAVVQPHTDEILAEV